METNVLRKHFDYLIQCTEKLQLSKHVFERYKNHYETILIFLHIRMQLSIVR